MKKLQNTLPTDYSDNREGTLHPSYWTVVPSGIIPVLLTFIGLPILLPFTIYRIIEIRCWRYHFNERTIIEQQGIFSVSHTELHYYRIKSIRIEEPFIMRLVGLSNVHIESSDPYKPSMRLYAVRNSMQIREFLRAKADYWRRKVGVREIDMHNI
jgi:uncharacterized membrane protein YdbT with pleckstrin-like domain